MNQLGSSSSSREFCPNQGRHSNLSLHTVYCAPVCHREHNRAHLILSRAHLVSLIMITLLHFTPRFDLDWLTKHQMHSAHGFYTTQIAKRVGKSLSWDILKPILEQLWQKTLLICLCMSMGPSVNLLFDSLSRCLAAVLWPSWF